jgi:hypothetical protein
LKGRRGRFTAAMRRVVAAAARTCVATALTFATLGARPVTHVPLEPAEPKPLAPATVLAKYAKALGAVARPHAISFSYTIEQLGLRNMEQTHRVYRSGLDERDETLGVDGYTLPRPSVRIIANRTYRYDVKAVAPAPSSYRFVYTGKFVHGRSFTYVFRTAAYGTPAFRVTGIEIDGTHFLPSLVRFTMESADAHGRGEIAYMSDGLYWVVRDAQVSAHLASGTIAHEHIAWGDYSFPIALPPSTFDAPSVHASEELENAGTPATAP